MDSVAAVARVWRGWTTPENADAYQSVVEGEVMPEIFARQIPGLISSQVLRADDVVDGEVEFTTIIWFESLDSVKNFMGDDYRQSHVPPAAVAVLKRFEPQAKHFHLGGQFA
jgi:heme-degrading monooxygenase HmoA